MKDNWRRDPGGVLAVFPELSSPRGGYIFDLANVAARQAGPPPVVTAALWTFGGQKVHRTIC